MWYFLHYDKDPMGNPLNNKKKDQKNVDLNIVTLIWLVKEIVSLIQDHKSHIQSGLAFYLQNDVFPSLMESMERLCESDDAKAPLIQNIMELIEKTDWNNDLPPEKISKHVTFTWLRFQNIQLLSNSTFGGSNMMSKFISAIPYLDSFEAECLQLGSIKDLLYYQNAVLEHIRDIMASETQLIKYTEVLGFVGADFELTVTQFWPMIAEWVTSQTECYTTEIYSVIGQYCGKLVHEVATKCMDQQGQILSSEAVKSFPKSDKSLKSKDKKKKVEPLLVMRPGWESQFNGRDAELMELKVQLRWLIFNLNHRQKARIGQMDFLPFEFLMDSLRSQFKLFINDVITIDTNSPTKENAGSAADDVMTFEIKRPSILHSQVKSYLAAVSYMDRITHLDCADVLQEVWEEQNNLEQAQSIADSSPDSLAFTMKSKQKGDRANRRAQLNPHHPFLISYVKWYTEFLVTKSHTGTCVYSQSHQAFCNTSFSTIQAEHFTDRHELVSLCELIGLSGFQFMEDRLTRLITINVASLDEAIHANFEFLKGIKEAKPEIENLAKLPRTF
jgi:NCK-associated protein 1